ncbi:MAG: MtnX-like HAD-IB family phosphatase [Candidatus Kapaibacteriota bacterium]
MKIWKLHIYSDFDGTIALTDVCIDIIEHFGEVEPYLTQLASGEIKLRDFWLKAFRTIPESVTIEQLYDFAKQQVKVDTYFTDFINFCRSNSIPFEILSDGFDFYIEATLEKIGIGKIPYFANSVVKLGKYFYPIFNYANESCVCLNVGSCKRNIALSLLRDDELLVYIGDGYSDFCMVEYADIVFAKGILSRYCNQKRIPHFNFKSFYEILSLIKKLVDTKQMRPRRQAQLNRKKAFEME